MNTHRNIIFLILLILLSLTLRGQPDERNWRLNGDVKYLEMVWIPATSKQWQTQGTLNNRLDFRYYPADFLRFHVGGRNIMNYGQLPQAYYPLYSGLATIDQGYMDLTHTWAEDSSYFIYSQVDRLYGEITAGKFEATVGRQRINWGINRVWTPNDIFNSFNYFDFDYPERPGCDAVLLQYHTGTLSSVQLAFKVGRNDKITSALMYNFNVGDYDLQALGGIMEDDYVAGAGWTGYIKGAGFNGEASYFIDRDRFPDTNGVLVASAGLNYTFGLGQGLYVNGSYLYNSAGTTGPAGWGAALALYLDISAKNFTRARHSLFAQASYPVTPLIRVDISGIWNPNDKSGYFGPGVDFSLTDNIGLLLLGQIFRGNPGTEFGDYGSMFFLRLKYGF